MNEVIIYVLGAVSWPDRPGSHQETLVATVESTASGNPEQNMTEFSYTAEKVRVALPCKPEPSSAQLDDHPVSASADFW